MKKAKIMNVIPSENNALSHKIVIAKTPAVKRLCILN